MPKRSSCGSPSRSNSTRSSLATRNEKKRLGSLLRMLDGEPVHPHDDVAWPQIDPRPAFAPQGRDAKALEFAAGVDGMIVHRNLLQKGSGAFRKRLLYGRSTKRARREAGTTHRADDGRNVPCRWRRGRQR